MAANWGNSGSGSGGSGPDWGDGSGGGGNPFLPGGGDGSGGGNNPFLPGGGGSRGTDIRKISKKTVTRVRKAIARHDEVAIRRIGTQAGLSEKNIKGLQFVAKLTAPDNSFLGKVSSGITDTLTGLPRGLYQTGVAGVHEVAQPALTLRDVIEGKKVSADQAIGSIPGIGGVYGISRGFVEGNPDPNANPLTTGIGASFRHTTNRLTDPQQFAHDYSQRPVQSFLEDAGNVAVVAGGAAKAARFAGLKKTANFLETGATRLQDVSNAPFLPVSPLARGANRALAKVVSKADTSARLRQVMAGLHVSPAAREAKQLAQAEVDRVGQVQNRIVREYVKPVEKLLPTHPQQEALFAVAKGQADALARIRAVSPSSFDEFVKDNAASFDNISVKGANLAADHASGVASKTTDRINKALPIIERASAERQAGALARGEISAEQVSNQPMAGVIEPAVRAITDKLPQAQARAVRLRARADAAAQRASDLAVAGQAKVARTQEMKTVGEFGGTLGRAGKLTGKDINAERAVARAGMSTERLSAAAKTRATMLDTRARAAERSVERLQSKAKSVRGNVAASVEAAPARYRPVLEANRAAISHLTSVENQLRGQGLDREAALVGQAAGEIPESLAKLNDAGIAPPHYIRTVERARGQRIGGTSTTRARPSATRQRTGLGKGKQSVTAQAQAEARRAAQVIHNETIAKLEADVGARAGEVLPEYGRGVTQQGPSLEELDKAGYAPLGRGEITPNTVVVPKEVVKVLHSYHRPAGPFEKVIEHTYDPLTRAFKASVLPLSPSWQIGNAIGNTFMAMAGGGVGPVELAHNIIRSLNEYRKTGQFPGPDRLRQHGATYEAQDVLRGGRSVGPTLPLPSRVRRLAHAVSPIRGGYGLNEFIDSLGRSAVYLSKKGKGYSDEMAVRQSLRAMGDFTNLSPFEKRIVRRVIPFYAWQKHMAKLALTMPIEHPLRTAFTLNLANQFKTQEDWESLLPGYLQGSIPIGGGNYVPAGGFFPFGNPLSGYENVKQGLNPLIKLGLVNIPGSPAQGINPYTGKAYSRPPGTGRFNEFGQALPTAPSLLDQIAQISPQVRAYRDLSGYNDVVRYESGDVVKVRDEKTGKLVPIRNPKTTAESLIARLGIQVKSKKELQSFIDSIIQREVQNYKDAHPTKKTKVKASKGGPFG